MPVVNVVLDLNIALTKSLDPPNFSRGQIDIRPLCQSYLSRVRKSFLLRCSLQTGDTALYRNDAARLEFEVLMSNTSWDERIVSSLVLSKSLSLLTMS